MLLQIVIRLKLCLGLALSICATIFPLSRCSAQDSYQLSLEYSEQAGQMEFLLVIDGKKFSSVELLKSYIKSLPSGSQIIWAPGCEVLPEQPLSSSEELKNFELFLKARGIAFIVVPSG